jgi:hypothetical protein
VPSAHLFDDLLLFHLKRVRSERVNFAASNTIFNSSDLGFDFATVVDGRGPPTRRTPRLAVRLPIGMATSTFRGELCSNDAAEG